MKAVKIESLDDLEAVLSALSGGPIRNRDLWNAANEHTLAIVDEITKIVKADTDPNAPVDPKRDPVNMMPAFALRTESSVGALRRMLEARGVSGLVPESVEPLTESTNFTTHIIARILADLVAVQNLLDVKADNGGAKAADWARAQGDSVFVINTLLASDELAKDNNLAGAISNVSEEADGRESLCALVAVSAIETAAVLSAVEGMKRSGRWRDESVAAIEAQLPNVYFTLKTMMDAIAETQRLITEHRGTQG